MKIWKRLLEVAISLQLAAAPTLAYAQSPQQSSPEEAAQFRSDAQLNYWAGLDSSHPELTEFALGEPVTRGPMSNLDSASPLLDQDPFFMRSQTWEASTEASCEKGSVCFKKDSNGLVLTGWGDGHQLRLKQNFSPILETTNYILLSADDDRIFREKNPDDQEPGEGIFYLRKVDLALNSEKGYPVPIFFFPLPDSGWTGGNKASFEMESTEQVVLHDRNAVALPIDLKDFALLERSQRDNLTLAQAFSFLEGKIEPNGVVYPKSSATISFGLILSGVQPQVSKQASFFNSELFRQVVSNLSILPAAQARDSAPTFLDRIRAGVSGRVKAFDAEYWKKWIFPVAAYGATLGSAAYLYQTYPIDWSSMITADLPERLTRLGMILGSVLASSVLMKYTIHKTKLDKIYPRAENETWLQTLNRHHKGIMTELAVGLYFSVAVLPQAIRHTLEYLKDHFMPSNHMLHRAWDATMGFQMRFNSHLAINWKTFYLGAIVFGMADSILVAVDLLIYTPFIMDQMGWKVAAGSAAASFATAEVMRNFLGYFQAGAHSYSADVKMIHMLPAEKEARRLLLLRGENPEAARNADEVQHLSEEILDRRFKSLGLPGKEEFLYDPISVLEAINAKAGFSVSTDGLTAEQKDLLSRRRFVLSKRRWGLIGPALKEALKKAQELQALAPSQTGAQTVQLLEWAINDRSFAKAIAGKVKDLALDSDTQAEAQAAAGNEVKAWLSKTDKPTRFGAAYAALKGSLKYLAVESTQKVRDIRRVIFLASTTGTLEPLAQFLPESWLRQAGSKNAALLGAELINRAFFSLYEMKPEMIDIPSAVEAKYSARAQKIIDRLSQKDPSLQDPFTRAVRHEQVVQRMQAKDETREKVLSYQPALEDSLAQKQWAAARKEAQKALTQAWALNDEQVYFEWTLLAGEYEELMSTDENPLLLDREDWAKSNRYRFSVAQAFAKEVGLTVNGLKDSKFVRRVAIKAAADTETEIKLENEQNYLSTLNADERRFYEAKIYTKHFISNYISLSVHTDDYLKASSPEFPGRFQKVRKALVGVPGGKVLNKFVNVFESLFRNEHSSYLPGKFSWLDRNLPLVPDLYHNFTRSLRSLPYLLSISYLTSYYVWQIQMPYSLWAVFVTVGFVGPAFIETNNRLQRLWDSKPMGDVPSKLTYSFIHSRMTNPEVMLLQTYADGIAGGFDSYVTNPISNAVKSCADLLKWK